MKLLHTRFITLTLQEFKILKNIPAKEACWAPADYQLYHLSSFIAESAVTNIPPWPHYQCITPIVSFKLVFNAHSIILAQNSSRHSKRSTGHSNQGSKEAREAGRKASDLHSPFSPPWMISLYHSQLCSRLPLCNPFTLCPHFQGTKQIQLECYVSLLPANPLRNFFPSWSPFELLVPKYRKTFYWEFPLATHSRISEDVPFGQHRATIFP